MSVSMTVPQLRRHECRIGGLTVRLQPALADFLALLLVSHPNRCLSRRELIEAMWPDAEREPETALEIVRVYVSTLRRLGITVECCTSFGYRIPAEARGLPQPMRMAA